MATNPTQQNFNFTSSDVVHIVGIGGAGMSAIAKVLAAKGHKVSGSDLADSSLLESLTQEGITTFVGHAAQNIAPETTVVTHSTAIPADNPELLQAASLGIPVLRRADSLAALTRLWKTVAVAGTHGKTTTSAMLTAVMKAADLDPSYIVGGKIASLGGGAAVGSGEHLIVEADESDGTFVELSVHGAIITNVEPDHLEHYGGFDNLKKAFVQFAHQAEGPTVMCADDSGAAALAAQVSATTYGTDQKADWRITTLSTDQTGISFRIENKDASYAIALQQPGLHNALNATAAFVMAVLLGADPQLAVQGLNNFAGVGRRFERRGSVSEIQLVDDYAHLPTEVEAALAAGKSTQPKRLVAVFQPHRYSRTEQLWKTFGTCFTDADLLIVTDIYSSGERPRPGISGELIVSIIAEEDPSVAVKYIPKLPDVVEYLVSDLESGDVCMTLGAGDLTNIPDQVLAGLQQKYGNSEKERE